MRLSRLITAFALAALPALLPGAAGAAELPLTGEPGRDFAAGELLVRFEDGRERLVELPDGIPVPAAAATLAANPRVAYATPNYVARAAASATASATGFVPNDPGLGNMAGDWQQLQWGFLPCGSGCLPPDSDGNPPQPQPFESKGGIDAPGAWEILRARGRPGGSGIKIAVLDTGIAFRSYKKRYLKSPDFARSQFLPGYDFVAQDKLPLDEDGHGTHVTGTIAEQTDNGKGLTGVAYGAKIIPVRVLNEFGEGRASEISQGILYAVKHGARVINLSFEFGPSVKSCRQIKSICQAIRTALRKRISVFGATGNEAALATAFPGRIRGVVGVGAATEGGCAAFYSSRGVGLDLVAPGGRGEVAGACRTQDRPIFQVTLVGFDLHTFGIPSEYMGTSMAAAHASGVAALVLASGVIGTRPTPARLACQLAATARKTYLGEPYDPGLHGAGLLDAARAVAAPAC